MRGNLFRPDGFAIGLLAIGLIMLFLPLMAMPGLIAILAACSYWLIMLVVKLGLRRRG
jgi:hypothetical protein